MEIQMLDLMGSQSYSMTQTVHIHINHKKLEKTTTKLSSTHTKAAEFVYRTALQAALRGTKHKESNVQS